MILTTTIAPFLYYYASGFRRCGAGPCRPRSLGPPVLFTAVVAAKVGMRRGSGRVVSRVMTKPFDNCLAVTGS